MQEHEHRRGLYLSHWKSLPETEKKYLMKRVPKYENRINKDSLTGREIEEILKFSGYKPKPMNEPCCEVFSKICREFTWFSLSEKEGGYVMPSFGHHYRVNYCPSCGAHVRNIELKDLP